MAYDNIAISVKDLGKKYSIGGPQEKYLTFRDAIVNSVKAPFRRLSSHESPREFWALKDVSFDVEQGEVVGIIGRNGAGKSTLLKILSRITAPTEGTVDLYGRVGSLLEVGTGFHQELTGRENIFLSGSILGMKRREIDAKLDEIVKFSEIEKFLDTPVKRYSSGMYVRLAFSVAAHLDTEILLVDEVLAVGDAAFQKKCLGKMGDVATKEGRTVIFVSHNMVAVQMLCIKSILLGNGEIKYKGDTESTINKYLSKQSLSNLSKNINTGFLAESKDKTILLTYIGAIGQNTTDYFSPRSGDDCKILIELYSTKKYSGVVISLGIFNNFQVKISHLSSEVSGSTLNLFEGNNRILCKITKIPLIPGNYTLNLKISKKTENIDIETILWAPDIGELFVESGDFFKTGRLPNSSWSGLCYIENDWESIS
jgi:lipopolysaccharide transport system ATP-binding protein